MFSPGRTNESLLDLKISKESLNMDPYKNVLAIYAYHPQQLPTEFKPTSGARCSSEVDLEKL